MTRITATNDFPAPVETVFEQFTDLDGIPARVSGIKAIDMLTTGPFRLGTRWRETRDVFGRIDSAEMEVTAYERNKTYTITHHKMGAKIDAVFTFEPHSRGTRVCIEFSLEGPGLPAGMFAPLEWAIGSRVREMLSQDLADLKGSL